MSSLARYRAILVESAERLSGPSLLPVDITGLCSRLGVHVMPTSCSGRRGRLLVSEKGATILIRSLRDLPFERFLIAHELGHLLLQDNGSAPLGEAEYWKHEHLCDAFASLLLLPEKILAAILASAPPDAKGVLHTVASIAKVGYVPWGTAAWRVAQLRPGVALFSLKDRLAAAGERNLRISFSALTSRKGIGTKFSPDDPVSTELARLPVGEEAAPLPAEVLVQSRSFRFLDGLLEAAVCRPGRNEFRLAAIFDATKSHHADHFSA